MGEKRKKIGWCTRKEWLLSNIVMLVLLFFFSVAATASASARAEANYPNPLSIRKLLIEEDASKRRPSPPTSKVSLHREHDHVVLDNGIVRLTLSTPDGFVTGISYNGIDNLLESQNDRDNRGYWDVVWYKPETPDIFDKLATTNFRVVVEKDDIVEVSFTKTWNPTSHDPSVVPLNVDKRFILRKGVSGLYMYAIMEREKGWPDVDMDQTRIVFKLRQDMFEFMALADKKQRTMPSIEDRENGKPLAYPEAVLLTKPTNPELKGEVDDKYQYSVEDKDNKLHGWVSSSSSSSVGFWMITPSDEFRNGGPTKQDLTSHVGPVLLNMFVSTHYAGKELDTRYRNGEPWKKVFGPVFLYLNSQQSSSLLWQNAEKQMSAQVKSWPYSFVESKDFPSSPQRGSVTGLLLVVDKFRLSRTWTIPAKFAHVGLAAPGETGSWQTESKGYQFWTQTDREGKFLIKNIRPGTYNLYAWVPGVIGDFKLDQNIVINPGKQISLGTIRYLPPRIGRTLWEIGYADRSAAEFYVPDPNPTLMNRLYTEDDAEKFRQYGLWERYTDLYPSQDLIFTVGVDNYRKDWFFAHVNRNVGNQTYKATTWQIIFKLANVTRNGNYTMQLALAAANEAELQVRFNDEKAIRAHFTTGLVGKDNAIARHGIHGLYHLYTIGVPNYRLKNGYNTIFLTQTRRRSPFQGVMYDYIRLEEPPHA